MSLFAGKKLLTIDDEDALRRSIQLFFEDCDFEVFEANNGRKGLEVFRQEKPDIVLVDLRMPEMDGLEVIQVLAKEAPEVPVIVVSGTGVLEDAIEAIRAGATDYVTKPVADLLVLEHTVQKALEKAALVAENRMYQENLEELVEVRTAELRQAQKMEAIGTLAGGIAHDFNNILTGILGYNELALMMCQEEKIRGYLDEMKKGADRAKGLVQQILTFSRKGEQEQQPVQLALIAREALKLIRSSIPTSIEVKQEIRSEANVLADPSQLHQIVMNLCTNAYHAMQDKGGQLGLAIEEVTLQPGDQMLGTDLAPGHYLDMVVSDTGCGMDKEMIGRIFDPYFTTKEAGRGTGLGLSVVHGIVGSYHGKISVHSEQGKGTTFHIYLPILEAESAHVQDQEINDIQLTGGERVLFVDDEQSIIDLAQDAFASFGYSVEVFSDSLAALARFKEDPAAFDLVVTDMTMPKMNGDELTRQVLELDSSKPVILCTGFSEVLNRESALELGVKEFVQKPVTMTELLRIVRQVLG